MPEDMKKHGDRRLWLETVLGVIASVVGMSLVGLMIWRSEYNIPGLVVGVGLVGFGSLYVNKLRAAQALAELGKVLKIWRGGGG